MFFQTPGTSNQNPFPFLDLPPELRVMVYDHVFPRNIEYIFNTSSHKEQSRYVERLSEQYGDTKAVPNLFALTQVNKLLREETLSMIQKRVKVLHVCYSPTTPSSQLMPTAIVSQHVETIFIDFRCLAALDLTNFLNLKTIVNINTEVLTNFLERYE